MIILYIVYHPALTNKHALGVLFGLPLRPSSLPRGSSTPKPILTLHFTDVFHKEKVCFRVPVRHLLGAFVRELLVTQWAPSTWHLAAWLVASGVPGKPFTRNHPGFHPGKPFTPRKLWDFILRT